MKIEWLTFNEEAPARGMWDQTLLGDILETIDRYDSDRVICVIPGASNFEYYQEINEYIRRHKKVLVIITSDENSLFDTDNLIHDDMIIYSQYPTDEHSKNVDCWVPIGYTPATRPTLKKNGLPNKDLEWFFAGQITHETREELAAILRDMENGILIETKGFTQGVAPAEYTKLMSRAMVVPSPHGVVKPEALRTYEALEAGAIPIPQRRGYHSRILEDANFVYLDDWSELKDYMNNYAQRFPKLNNIVQSWWLQQKRKLRERLLDDLNVVRDPITVLISTSPIPTNPNTDVIEKSIESIRHHLPHSEIIIMADGVREEQKHLEPAYHEFLRKILWKCNLEWENVTCVVYENHIHQLGLTRETLPLIKTDLVMFMEHDMLLKEKSIPIDKITSLLQGRQLDVMRFYFDRILEPAHQYLMLDKQPIMMNGVPVVRTGQWSQRPHIAKKSIYEDVLNRIASKRANCMIEDAIHGHIANNFVENGKSGWNDCKIAIYTPDDDFSYAYHIDGRGDESKFEKEQVF